MVGGELVEQVDGVAEGAAGLAGDQLEAALGDGDALAPGDLAQALDERLERGATEVEALAARADGGRDLVRLGGREHEDDVWRRLLEGLEQRVEGRVGQHVDLVDEVDLVGRRVGGVADALAQGADLVDAAVGGGVELDQVERAALVEREAGVAGVVGLAPRGRLAVDGLGEDAAGAGLARAARAGEEVGVRGRPGGDGVAQRGGDRVLPGDVGEAAGAPLAVEDFLAQGPPARPTGGLGGRCGLSLPVGRPGRSPKATLWALRSRIARGAGVPGCLVRRGDSGSGVAAARRLYFGPPCGRRSHPPAASAPQTRSAEEAIATRAKRSPRRRGRPT